MACWWRRIALQLDSTGAGSGSWARRATIALARTRDGPSWPRAIARGGVTPPQVVGPWARRMTPTTEVSGVSWARRLYNSGALTVAATDAYFANVVLLLHFDGYGGLSQILDSSSFARVIGSGGDAQVDTVVSKFGGSSGLFDGTGDYFYALDSVDFTFGSGDFTIECWFNRAGGDGVTRLMLGHINANLSLQNFMFGLFTDNKLIFDTSGPTVRGTTAITAAGWHHAAVVRTGNILKMFLDGVQEGGDVAIVVPMTDSNGVLAIGRWGDSNQFYWNGWIDDVRITKGVARYTSGNFTPPTTTFPDA